MSNCLSIQGISIRDGERIGCLFYTGKLFFGIYNQKRGSIIWDEGDETDLKETETNFEVMNGIEKWLER